MTIVCLSNVESRCRYVGAASAISGHACFLAVWYEYNKLGKSNELIK